MQIITDVQESRIFIKNLGQSLNDLNYWNDWVALHITVKPHLDWIKQAKITALVRTNITNRDGSVLWLDESMMIVFQSQGEYDPVPFEKTLREALALESVTIQLIHVAQETNVLQKVIGDILATSQKSLTPPPANYALLKSLVPNVDDLLRNWHTNNAQRNERAQPLIMIVDDDLMTLRLVSKSLAKEYSVITAQSGAEAIAKHLQQMPDIIFLDIGLPDCDGLTLLNYMQQYDKDCRIVMFSADDFLKTRVKALADGAKGFLPKPFNLEGFKKQIGAWFSAR